MIVTAILPIAVYQLFPLRKKPGGTWLFFGFLAAYEWTFCAFLESLSFPQSTKILFSMIEYLGYSTYPVTILLFALSYSGIRTATALKTSRLRLLFIPSLIITISAFTNPLHNLLWTGFTPGPESTLIYHHGPLFWIFTLIFFLEVLATISTFFLTAISDRSRRKESLILMWTLSLPWWAGILYVTHWNPFPGYEITSLSAGISTVIISLLIKKRVIAFTLPGIITQKIPRESSCWIVTDRKNEIRFSSEESGVTADEWKEQVISRGDKISIIPIEFYGELLSLLIEEPLEPADLPVEQEELIRNLESLFADQKLYTNQALDLETLAMHLRTNRSYLSQAVNRQYDMSLPNLINRYRVAHYMEETRKSAELYSIEERAKMAGFSCKSTFYRVFKKSYGMSPKEWHDQLNEKGSKSISEPNVN